MTIVIVPLLFPTLNGKRDIFTYCGYFDPLSFSLLSCCLPCFIILMLDGTTSTQNRCFELRFYFPSPLFWDRIIAGIWRGFVFFCGSRETRQPRYKNNKYNKNNKIYFKLIIGSRSSYIPAVKMPGVAGI